MLKNQYRGINAHLHSQLQAEPEKWDIFHQNHITHLAEALQNQHYAVRLENSAVVIEQESLWLELLRPADKTSHREAYFTKRDALLEKGWAVIELDYLHETLSTFDRYSPYSIQNERTHAYRIAVMRANFEPSAISLRSRVDYYPFDVDEVIPKVTLPNGDIFDFGAVYQKTFEAIEGFVEYSELPMNFERYHVADQRRILGRMLTVIEAIKDGRDLTLAPLPLKFVSEPPKSRWADTFEQGIAVLTSHSRYLNWAAFRRPHR